MPSFVRHDAISSHVLQARTALRQAGYRSDIWYEQADRAMAGEGRPFTGCDPTPRDDRVLLYHASTSSQMAPWLAAAASRGQRLAVDYHNITPARYFTRWEPEFAESMQSARTQLADLAPHAGLAMADSEYNRRELVELGYQPTTVCPLLIDLDGYLRDGAPARRSASAPPARRTGTSWLFVGRLAPNKCQHDVIGAFAVYRRLFDRDARLHLVGKATSFRYQKALRTLASDLQVGDSVEFRGAVSSPDLIDLYRSSDVFVCLSEHEGFCVPVLEAMLLGLPVVAVAAAAVGDTVGDGGVLMDGKDPLDVACVVADLLADGAQRDRVIQAGRRRAARFALPATSSHFVDTLAGWIGSAR